MTVTTHLKVAGLFQAFEHNPPEMDNADDAPKLEVKPSGSTPELRYIYYRVYTPDGAIPSKSPVTSHKDSPYIGRIRARAIPPPHTVLSLKRCLAHAEGVSDPGGVKTSLYPHLGARTAMPNGTKIAITAMSNGSTPETALALLLPEKHVLEPDFSIMGGASGSGERRVDAADYLYYRLYTQVGEDASKASFDSEDPALGRIERAHISPPHEPASIKRCIARLEENAIYTWAELYREVSADAAMPEASPVPLGREGGVGSVEKPMVLVQPERSWRFAPANPPPQPRGGRPLRLVLHEGG